MPPRSCKQLTMIVSAASKFLLVYRNVDFVTLQELTLSDLGPVMMRFSSDRQGCLLQCSGESSRLHIFVIEFPRVSSTSDLVRRFQLRIKSGSPVASRQYVEDEIRDSRKKDMNVQADHHQRVAIENPGLCISKCSAAWLENVFSLFPCPATGHSDKVRKR